MEFSEKSYVKLKTINQTRFFETFLIEPVYEKGNPVAHRTETIDTNLRKRNLVTKIMKIHVEQQLDEK